MMMPNQFSDPEETRPPRTMAEWVTFSLASLILLTLIGLAISLWVAKKYQQPPEIVVSSSGKQIQKSTGQFYVPFFVTNKGGETAESVQILAELSINNKVVESGEQQIDFLSGGELEEGAFIFTQNPQAGKISIRVASYKLP
jgi:uncharacterized protein (TIGR02588 family)